MNKIGVDPSPNPNIAKGSREVPGIGAYNVRRVSKSMRTLDEIIAREQNVSVMREEQTNAVNRILRLIQTELWTKGVLFK